MKSAISSVRQITQSDFIGASLPNSDDGLQLSALDFVIDGDAKESEFVAGEGSIPVRVFRTCMLWTGSANEIPKNRKDSVTAPGLKTVCVLPLLSRERALGVLVVGNRNGKTYARKDVDFLTQLANQIAIAAENALPTGASQSSRTNLLRKSCISKMRFAAMPISKRSSVRALSCAASSSLWKPYPRRTRRF